MGDDEADSAGERVDVAKIAGSGASQVKVTQVGSAIGQSKSQGATLRGLGLRRIGTSRVLADTPSIRGMIGKVRHLIRVEPV